MTPSEWLAFHWPRGHTLDVLIVIALLAASAMLGFVVTGGVIDWLLLFLCIAAVFVLAIAALILTMASRNKLFAMKQDSEFRFYDMQDGTPSFMVWKVYLEIRGTPVPGGSDESTINAWMIQQWPNDKRVFGRFNMGDRGQFDSRMWQALIGRFDSFKRLGLHFTPEQQERFDRDCGELIEKYRNTVENWALANIADSERALGVEQERLEGLKKVLKRVQLQAPAS
ncbi:MAG: hypothetical protein V4611_03340 [Patescibacteria group bacterium]